MSTSRTNIAGLTSPQQQSEMKSILAGAWPPLKPLPVFRYETPEYRAKIDFDKLRGEWVCRKTSLPSNKIQELRGELREITLALPPGEAEILMEVAEEPEQELEKDTNRRLQALGDWRENYENGARYFELRNRLSESQRRELDDSLRLSLTARQLQCNSKNIAYVFDALSAAGGRFATLIEFANRNKPRQETAPQAPTEGAVHEAENVMDHGEQSAGTSSEDCGDILPSNDPSVRDPEAAERCTGADELPAVSVKNVFPEQYAAPVVKRMADAACEQFVSESPEIVDADSPSLVEHADEQGRHSSAFADLALQMQTGQPSADRSGGSSSRFPVLEISAFHLAVFGSLFLFAVIAIAMGLTVGRGPLGSRLQEASKSMLSFHAKSPAPTGQAGQPASRIPIVPVTGSDETANANKLDAPKPSEEKFKENAPVTQHSADGRSTDSSANSISESKPSGESADRPKAIGKVNSAPRSPAPSKPTPTMGVAPHLPRASTILVNVPSRGSQPFRVSFPEKTIAASPTLAMSSQLSVLVSSGPRPVGAHRPARLEAGELVSFVWPHYPKLGERFPQVIRVRATVGPLGQVRDVKLLSGSASLLSATARAIRQWRYTPTLLDKRPVQTQQELTIEFRPQQYSSQAATRHATQKLVAAK
jgi:Gram-negative bacterial TonB protein C-terminal